jgi:hypothetical protein
LERCWPAEFTLRNVHRPEEQTQQPEEPIPSEVLRKHRELMSSLLEEDKQRSAAQSESSG